MSQWLPGNSLSVKKWNISIILNLFKLFQAMTLLCWFVLVAGMGLSTLEALGGQVDNAKRTKYEEN